MQKYYRSIENSIQQNTQIQVRSIVSKLYSKKNTLLQNKETSYMVRMNSEIGSFTSLLPPEDPQRPQTWTVPNVIPPGRPIVSDCSSATYNISLYIDRFLGPLSFVNILAI